MSKPPLDREEYVEQAYFFRVLRERQENTPIQDILASLREEILATTKLPMAIDLLIGELRLKGTLGHGMSCLPHYFAPFQTFILRRAEEDSSKLDFRVALHILERQAEFIASEEDVNPAALFIFQFECIARNRLGYDAGLLAVSQDPVYPDAWKTWISRIRFELGTVDFAELVYLRSQLYLDDLRKRRGEAPSRPTAAVLFDSQAGRIARANLGKDPLYMFAALQRQLGYPAVPRPVPPRTGPLFEPQVEMRFQRLETRLSLLEQEQREGLDLTQFYRTDSEKPAE